MNTDFQTTFAGRLAQGDCGQLDGKILLRGTNRQEQEAGSTRQEIRKQETNPNGLRGNNRGTDEDKTS
ncbi:hypothetical protein QQF64_035910 [Cirrhinus molitorella]|uniref:Uncharacterized protein n=1 Tax=Cirrhinus molitorella TaxID=172907 RepID=A0ABR3NH30_9TELE